MLKPVPDHIKEQLLILFIGFNPSLKSAECGHHYANASNRFWSILYQAGLTPRKYSPEEDQKLLELGYGLTNIASRPTRAAKDISREEYSTGREALRALINQFQPAIACFVGKGVYCHYSGRRQIPWGVQEEGVVKGVLDFVAPSSSGLVRISMKEIVAIYKQLKHLMDELGWPPHVSEE